MARKDYNDSNRYEAAAGAIRGSMALADVVCEMTTENDAGWAKFVIEDVQLALRVLLQCAHDRLDALQHENWISHALLGTYGEEAKSRALSEVAAESKS